MKPAIEKEISIIYKIGLILKGLVSLLELFGGIIILSVSKTYIIVSVLNIFQNELSDDPNDFLANFIVNSAATFSVSSQLFIGLYLLIHGAVKVFIIINILRKKIWAYPVAIVLFSFFILYQAYRLYFTHLSLKLGLIGIGFDTVVLILVIIDYVAQRKRLPLM